DPVISAQLSLWNQSGSTVIRGSMLVIPVGTSFLYLEPIYLQSTSSAFPELTKVVVTSSTSVAWGDTLADALVGVTSGAGTGGGTTASGGTTAAAGAPGASPGASSGPTAVQTVTGASGAGGLPTDVSGLLLYANQHFAAAEAAQARGDSVTYGQDMQQLQNALNALNTLIGGTLVAPPSPAASQAP
ncbi:MAG: hypothetical protein ACLQBX_02770, partial [Candidatus Limnocylindrales bacterium]